MYRPAAGAERENATCFKSAGCVSQKLVAGAGFEPQEPVTPLETKTSHNLSKPIQNRTLGDSEKSLPEQNLTEQPHLRNTSSHQKSVRSVYADRLPEDLAELVGKWPDLPEKVKGEILIKVREAR